MTESMWTLLITNVVTFLAACTALVKSKMTDNARAQTKVERDKAEQEIRDMVLSHDIELKHLKDAQALTATVVDELRDTCSQLNTSIVKLDVNVQNLTEAVKTLKNP